MSLQTDLTMGAKPVSPSLSSEPLVTVGGAGDFFALMKPRVMSLVVFTGLVGILVAPGTIHPVTAIAALICIAVGAGAAGALNMWYDADIDAVMQRTANRPIPRGKVAPGEALGFGATMAVGSVLMMGVLINWVAAALLALTIGFYLFVYTMWLKRRTPQNIVIGGAAGAFPPMIGWAVTTGSVAWGSVALFLLIFIWTPPHFWALALYRARDYERVGVPMLPVVAGGDVTRRHILVYSIALVAVSVLPYILGIASYLYLGVSVVLGVGFLFCAWKVFVVREGAEADRVAKSLFRFSIFYLFALFASILIEVSGVALLAKVGMTL